MQAAAGNNGSAVPVPTPTESNVTFLNSGVRSIEGAVGIKGYNGNSIRAIPDTGTVPGFRLTPVIPITGRYYCYWSTISPQQWALSRFGSNTLNYVQPVCDEVDP